VAILASVPTPLVIFPEYVYPMFQKGSFLRCFSSSLSPSRIFLPRTSPKLGIEEVDVKVVIGTRH
jgi:hypothetical protein